MNNQKLLRNIKILVGFFSACFLAMILYLTYFTYFKADIVVKDVTNPRIRSEEEDTIRGSIFDNEGEKIAYTQLTADGKQQRIYKYGTIFAHITGYDSLKYGKTGLELAYNDVLLGKGGDNNILNVISRELKEGLGKDKKSGYDVYLTLDRTVQQSAYNALGSDKGAVVALNPKTGEVISLVSKPSFNPGSIDSDFDKLRNDTAGKPFVNRAVQGYYPPGSIFKIITSAAAIENIPNIRNQLFNDTGKLNFGDYTLSNYGGEAFGKINMDKAFRVSSNTTFGRIGIMLGYDKLKNMAERFMFNSDIAVDDKYDALNIKSGSISIDDNESNSQIAQDAIGQNGVTANPMQMALVTSVIANNGIMMKPYIVEDIKDKYGDSIYKTTPEEMSQVIDKGTADIIKSMMIGVVKTGTGTSVRIQGITIAAKTGSAENETGDAPHSWFVAFAPADNPQIAVAAVVENGGKGGGRAAEVCKEVIKAYLKK